jgi:hypothetical protein
MTSGETGITFYSSCSNSVILANNFSGVSHSSINDGGVAQEVSQTIGNILGRGNGCHLKAYFPNGPDWFLYNNQFVDANLDAVSPFTDAASLWAHITP